MGTLMELPPETVIQPGHADPTTVAEEWEHNAFIRVWRGLDGEGSERCTALGEPATLVLLGGDYDGGNKAWVRWPDGSDDIVPGSQVKATRLSDRPPIRSVAWPREKNIPTSRVRRTATVGRLAASEAVKQFGTRAANVTRGEQASEEALARRQLETAKQIVAALGTMKGAAMKLGQVMSFLDVGLVPEEHREEFQRELAEAARRGADGVLQADAQGDRGRPRRADHGGVRVLRRGADRGGLDRAGVPRAAERRRPRGGREGPVPGGRRGRARRHAEPRHDHAPAQADDPGAGRARRRTRDPGAHRGGARLRARGPEPALAGAHLPRAPVHRGARRDHRALARAGARERVRGAASASRSSRATRRRSATASGEIVFRFFLGCLYRHRQFSGDPHPGNFMLLDDGRVAFLDFGLFKRMDAEPVELELAAPARGDRGRRAGAARAAGARRASCPSPSGSTPRSCCRSSRTRSGGTPRDEVVELTPEIATAGDDRELRPALAPLPRDAPPGHAPPSTSSAGAWRC